MKIQLSDFEAKLQLEKLLTKEFGHNVNVEIVSPPPVAVAFPNIPLDEMTQAVYETPNWRAGGKLAAIRAVRDLVYKYGLNLSLVDAENFVNALNN